MSGIVGVVLSALLVAALSTGIANAVVLAALAFGMSVRGTLLGAASPAMLKQIVPVAQLPRAFAVNEGRQAVVGLGAAPAGGALLALGMVVPVVAQLVGHLGVVVSTLSLRGAYRPRASDAPRSRVRDDLVSAARWCLGQPVRRHLMLSSLLVNFGSNGLILSVVLVLTLDGESALRVGLLETMLSAGILVGALLAPRLLERVPSGSIMAMAMLAIAGGAVAVPFLGPLELIGAVYFAMAIGIAPLNAASQGFFVHITPTSMQGRVTALSGLASMGLMPFAPAIAGFGLTHLGRMPTLGLFALICGAGALVLLRSKELRALPVASGWEGYARALGLAGE